jgi:hypothetical protein
MKEPKYITELYHIVSQAHLGQKYGDRPYIEHVLEVVEETISILANRDIWPSHPEYWFYVGTALGHDIVEDTEVTLLVLIESKIPMQIIGGINGMTKRNKETRDEYINRVKFDKFSHLVKQADSLRNLTWSIRAGAGRRIRKYTEYLKLLGAGDMYIVKDSPNSSRLRFISNGCAGTYHLHDQMGNTLMLDNSKLEQVG